MRAVKRWEVAAYMDMCADWEKLFTMHCQRFQEYIDQLRPKKIKQRSFVPLLLQ